MHPGEGKALKAVGCKAVVQGACCVRVNEAFKLTMKEDGVAIDVEITESIRMVCKLGTFLGTMMRVGAAATSAMVASVPHEDHHHLGASISWLFVSLVIGCMIFIVTAT